MGKRRASVPLETSPASGVRLLWDESDAFRGLPADAVPYSFLASSEKRRALLANARCLVLGPPWGTRKPLQMPTLPNEWDDSPPPAPLSPAETLLADLDPTVVEPDLWRWAEKPGNLVIWVTCSDKGAQETPDSLFLKHGLFLLSLLVGHEVTGSGAPALTSDEVDALDELERSWVKAAHPLLRGGTLHRGARLKAGSDGAAGARDRSFRLLGWTEPPDVTSPILQARPLGNKASGYALLADCKKGRLLALQVRQPQSHEDFELLRRAAAEALKTVPYFKKGWPVPPSKVRWTLVRRADGELDIKIPGLLRPKFQPQEFALFKCLYDKRGRESFVTHKVLWDGAVGKAADRKSGVDVSERLRTIHGKMVLKLKDAGIANAWRKRCLKTKPGAYGLDPEWAVEEALESEDDASEVSSASPPGKNSSRSTS